MAFSATSLLTGMLGSGIVGCDARLQEWAKRCFSVDFNQFQSIFDGYKPLLVFS